MSINKPKKKDPDEMYGKTYHDKCCRAFGYNQCCDELEKWLASIPKMDFTESMKKVFQGKEK